MNYEPSLTVAIEQMRETADRLTGDESEPGGRTVKINETLLRSWLGVLEHEAERKLAAAVGHHELAGDLDRIADQIARWARYDDVPPPGLDAAATLRKAATVLAEGRR